MKRCLTWALFLLIVSTTSGISQQNSTQTWWEKIRHFFTTFTANVQQNFSFVKSTGSTDVLSVRTDGIQCEATPVSFEKLVEASDTFARDVAPFPVQANRIKVIAG